MTTLRESRGGNVSREGGGFKTRELGGCWELEDLIVNTTAAPVRFVGVSGEAHDFCNQEGMVVESRWRCVQ